jgi:hypothetical protein
MWDDWVGIALPIFIMGVIIGMLVSLVLAHRYGFC